MATHGEIRWPPGRRPSASRARLRGCGTPRGRPTRGVELVWTLVDHPHFTPERIRRFVAHRLPVLEGLDAPVTRGDACEAVSAEIRGPTDAMATSLAALPADHRALLVALLDTPPGPVAERDLADWAATGGSGGPPDIPLLAPRPAAERDVGAPLVA